MSNDNNQTAAMGGLNLQSACLLILSVIAVTGTLMYLRAVMVPFILSVFLYFMFTPLVGWIDRKLKLPRFLSVSISLLLVSLFIAFVVLIISTSISGFLEGAEFYKQRLLAFVKEVETILLGFDIQLDLKKIQNELQSTRVVSLVGSFTGEFMGVIGNFFLIFIFLVFLLISQTRTVVDENSVFSKISSNVSKYIWTKFIVSLSTGILVGVILAILGMDLAFMFGFLAFLLNFIPSVGSLMATLVPLPVALLQFGVGLNFFLVLAIPGVIQFTIGNVIEPRMMGRNLDLHPVTVLFFLLFWGIVWGIPGMFLAVPITAVVKTVLDQFSTTRRVGEFLAGRF